MTTSVRSVDWTWIVLISLTLAGVAIGEGAEPGFWVTLTIAAIAAFKGRLVIDQFMELGSAHPTIRRLVPRLRAPGTDPHGAGLSLRSPDRPTHHPVQGLIQKSGMEATDRISRPPTSAGRTTLGTANDRSRSRWHLASPVALCLALSLLDHSTHAEDLPRGDCGSPATATDLRHCDLGGAKLQGGRPAGRPTRRGATGERGSHGLQNSRGRVWSGPICVGPSSGAATSPVPSCTAPISSTPSWTRQT